MMFFENQERRGYWGDVFNDFQIGSKLWLLQREKITKETLNLLVEYAKQSLEWLIEDGHVKDLNIESERVGYSGVQLNINLTQGNKESNFAFPILWGI